jgi:hypothetical protein
MTGDGHAPWLHRQGHRNPGLIFPQAATITTITVTDCSCTVRCLTYANRRSARPDGRRGLAADSYRWNIRRGCAARILA